MQCSRRKCEKNRIITQKNRVNFGPASEILVTLIYFVGLWLSVRRRNEWVLQQVGNPESFESTIVRLRLKYFGHCNRKDGSLEKDLMMGLTAGRRKRRRPPRRWLDGVTGEGTLRETSARFRDRAGWRNYANRVTKGRNRPDGL